jgi:formiminotetrahydrofolate cyclodeaminase
MDDFKKFCSELGSDAPAPGGGAAAGLVISLGAACVEKAIRFSEFDFKEELIEEITGLRTLGFELSGEDQEAFLGWKEARGLPRESDEEKEFRKDEITRHVAWCVTVPFRVCQAAHTLVQCVDKLLPVCNDWLISDAAIGSSMARAAWESALFNIQINLPYLKDEKLREHVMQFIDKHGEKVISMVEKQVAECGKKLS